MCQIPRIDKMDDSLINCENCERLSISTNAIDRIITLPKLKKLKILSLGRNNIKGIGGLEDVGQTLEELWISYNIIEKLDGLQPCIKLHSLLISNNKINKFEEIGKLSQLPEIKTALFVGNPVYGDKPKEENWVFVIKKVPQLETLDGKTVDNSIRKQAEELD